MSPVVQTFAVPDGVDIIRRTAGSRVDGIYTPASGTTIHLDPVVVYPATGRVLRRNPQLRSGETVVVIANVPLYTLDEQSGRDADVLTWDGLTYEAHTVESWGPNANYWRGLFVKVVTT